MTAVTTDRLANGEVRATVERLERKNTKGHGRKDREPGTEDKRTGAPSFASLRPYASSCPWLTP